MVPMPDTRHSLLLRLKDHSDQHAWQEFVEIYQPFMMQMIRRQGLQEADALEVCQEMLVTLTRQVEKWQPDPSQGSFRGWLYRVSKNQVINYVSRRKYRPQSAQSSGQHEALNSLATNDEIHDEFVETEFRRHLFQWAAKRVRPHFAETTWNAFWLSCVEGLTTDEVASRLGITRGKVYVSRCRVLVKLRERVQEWTHPQFN